MGRESEEKGVKGVRTALCEGVLGGSEDISR